jgi:DNA-binding transcriptional LysR family regulator
VDIPTLSRECQLLLVYVCNVSTSSESRWESIAEAAESLEMPLEQVSPRIDELVAKGLLERRTRGSVAVTEAGRRLAKRLRHDSNEAN